MSFELPANVKRDLELYAKTEHISPAEAATKLIREALKGKSTRAVKLSGQGNDWETFQRLVPGVDLFQQLPDDTVDEIKRGSRRIRAEKLTPRA
ncbi:hypothetical protein [Fimbriimonas ginsengisoli]|uniref:hypothetical protein n=1 Tax=Fimbriimonas ginsengisoli TaxID=1005039 RepID=UPI00046D1FB5|nr:hypothetical protein [Fimbriimonas ginsengisoli]